MAELSAACRAVDEDLSALLDAELSEQREAEVRAHLEACERCTRRLEQLCDVDLSLAGLPAPQPPADLEARLMRRLEAPAAGRGDPRARRRAPPRLRRAWGLGAAGAAAAAALAAYLVLRAPGPPTDAPLAQQPEAAAPAGSGPASSLAGTAPPAADAGADAPTAPQAPALARAPQPEPGEALEALDDAELALLLDLDAVEDLEVIANLDLLERFLALGPREGSG